MTPTTVETSASNADRSDVKCDRKESCNTSASCNRTSGQGQQPELAIESRWMAEGSVQFNKSENQLRVFDAPVNGGIPEGFAEMDQFGTLAQTDGSSAANLLCTHSTGVAVTRMCDHPGIRRPAVPTEYGSRSIQ